jgi:hypothetical protein
MMKRMVNISILSTLLLSVAVATEHREHGAHVHGGGTLAIAFDSLKGRVEFKAAAAGIVGFEYEVKTTKDRKTVEGAVTQFEKNITKMIQFDPALGCHFSKDKIAMQKESPQAQHADFVANFNVTCAKSILGSKLIVDFTSFSEMKDLDITVLVDSLQKTAEAKSQTVTIELQ